MKISPESGPETEAAKSEVDLFFQRENEGLARQERETGEVPLADKKTAMIYLRDVRGIGVKDPAEYEKATVFENEITAAIAEGKIDNDDIKYSLALSYVEGKLELQDALEQEMEELMEERNEMREKGENKIYDKLYHELSGDLINARTAIKKLETKKSHKDLTPEEEQELNEASQKHLETHRKIYNSSPYGRLMEKIKETDLKMKGLEKEKDNLEKVVETIKRYITKPKPALAA